MAIRSNLFLLHSKKESHDKRRIPYSEVSRETGVTKAQISHWMNDKIKMFSKETVEKLCNYYECTPGDLIVQTSRNRGTAVNGVGVRNDGSRAPKIGLIKDGQR